MSTQTLRILKKSLNAADETRRFGASKLELVTVENTTIGRATLLPGWKWSKDVRPLVNTRSCQAAHTQYIISGRLAVAMDDGTQIELQAGDAAVIPPGHDAWVVGNEPCVLIDFTGMKAYGTQSSPEAIDQEALDVMNFE